MHGKQSRAEGWNIVILVLMEVIRSMIHRRESVLNSKVWVIVGIVVLAFIALAAAIGIYMFLQFHQVIV